LAAFRVWLAGLEFSQEPNPPHRPLPAKEKSEESLRNFLSASQLRFCQGLDQGDPQEALLAVRAARRAVRNQPKDAGAHLLLYQALATQSQLTREQAWLPYLPPLSYVRQVQMIQALQTAINLQKNSRLAMAAHAELARMYRDQLPYPDLALKHRQEQLRLLRKLGLGSEEADKDLNKTVKQLEELNERLEIDVETRKLRFSLRTARNKRVLERAETARQMGLGEEALETLLQANVMEFGAAGARLELDLLLTVGRADEVRELLTDKDVARAFAAILGFPIYRR
jgi:hypothetical protein